MTSADVERRYHSSPCGLLTTTIGGTILDANDTLLRWLGRDREAVRGASLASLLDPSSRLFLETRYNQVLLLQGRAEQVALSMVSASGDRLPVLISSVVDADGPERLVHSALFDAGERRAYEQELLRARRAAELSERRVRILQEISAAFEVSASDEDVADTVVRVARDAFAASHVSFLLMDAEGELHPIAGSNPLWGVVAPIEVIRDTDHAIFLTAAEAHAAHPELGRGMADARLEGMSVIPLRTESRRLGLLACFFERTRELDAGFLELQESLSAQASRTLVRVRLQRELAQMALFDQLTGVPNRPSIRASVDNALDDAQATGHPLTMIFLDVDDFKSVNDTFGHAIGDDVLRALAERLREGVRAGDLVGRIGGDEFVAVCAHADRDAAAVIAERIVDLGRAPFTTADGSLHVSVSVGAAVYDPSTDVRPTTDTLLSRADGAMYLSKASGKDRYLIE